MARFTAGDVIDFEYNGTHRRAIVLNALYQGRVHVVDLNRLSQYEKQQFYGIIYPSVQSSKSWFMKNARRKLERKPNAHLKSPRYFYINYIGPLVRDKRCYRVLNPRKIHKARIVTDKIRFDKTKPIVGLYKWMKLSESAVRPRPKPSKVKKRQEVQQQDGLGYTGPNYPDREN